MNDFHTFVKKLFLVWLGLYALLLLPGLVKGVAFYVIFDFMLPIKHYLAIMNTLHLGLLWLIPTAFLALAYYLSRPGTNLLQE